MPISAETARGFHDHRNPIEFKIRIVPQGSIKQGPGNISVGYPSVVRKDQITSVFDKAEVQSQRTSIHQSYSDNATKFMINGYYDVPVAEQATTLIYRVYIGKFPIVCLDSFRFSKDHPPVAPHKVTDFFLAIQCNSMLNGAGGRCEIWTLSIDLEVSIAYYVGILLANSFNDRSKQPVSIPIIWSVPILLRSPRPPGTSLRSKMIASPTTTPMDSD